MFDPSGSSSLNNFNFLDIFCLVRGFQTEEAYSTCGLTKVLYASSLTASFL